MNSRNIYVNPVIENADTPFSVPITGIETFEVERRIVSRNSRTNIRRKRWASFVLAFVFTMLAVLFAIQSAMMAGFCGSSNAFAMDLEAAAAHPAPAGLESDFALKADYQEMDDDEKAAYEKLYYAAFNRLDGIDLEGADANWMFDIYIRMRYDSPEIFYLDDEVTTVTETAWFGPIKSTSTKFVFEYLYSNDEIDAMQTSIDEVVAPYRSYCLNLWEDAPDSLKAEFLSDALIKMAEYEDAGDERCHTIAGAMLDGKGVCESYALAYTLLCRSCGLECRTVIGDVPESYDIPDVCHAWNAVSTEDGWVGIDTCKGDKGQTAAPNMLMNHERAQYLGYMPFDNNRA